MTPLSEAPKACVIVYTDGGASPNPGLGGWGALLVSPAHGGAERELYGAEPDTTNNRMEITAAIQALRALKYPCRVELHTDSTYNSCKSKSDTYTGFNRNYGISSA